MVTAVGRAARERIAWRLAGQLTGVNRLWLLIVPAFMFFLVFFIIPVASLFIIAFNPSIPGVVSVQSEFTLRNFLRFFESSLYYGAAIRSIAIACTTAVIALALGYPLAYFIAKTNNPRRSTFYTLLVLIAMQLDLVIRMYGLMVLLGDNGLINGTLIRYGLLSSPLPLMYNTFGVVVGLVQLSLPFMVLSLVGIIRTIDPSLEEAARSLGASRWQTFWRITFPLSMPGVLSGSLLVFAIAISSYVVPALMGGWRVIVMPIHIYQQIQEMGYWQFGSAIAVILFVISTAAVYIYHRYTEKYIGGLV